MYGVETLNKRDCFYFKRIIINDIFESILSIFVYYLIGKWWNATYFKVLFVRAKHITMYLKRHQNLQ